MTKLNKFCIITSYTSGLVPVHKGLVPHDTKVWPQPKIIEDLRIIHSSNQIQPLILHNFHVTKSDLDAFVISIAGKHCPVFLAQ